MTKTVTSRFILKGDNQTARAFGAAKREMDQLGKKVGLFVSASIVGGALIVKNQAEQIDKLAKTADAYRISTESLQALNQQAELNGITTQDFDKKLGKLQKNLGEIARRGGTMAEALEDVGLNIADVIDLPLDQQLEAVSVALSKMENQTLRASIAGDLFGRDAAKMLKVTDELAKNGIAGVREELEALGVLVSRSEAAGVERMNDTLLRASKVADGLAKRFTVELAPAVTAVAEMFLEAAKESGGFKEETADAADGVVKAFGFVLDVVDSVGRAFKIAANLGIIGFESLALTVWTVADAIVNGPNRALDGLIERLDALPGVDIDFRFGALAPGLQQDLAISERIILEAKAEIDRILMAPLPSAELKQRLAQVRAEMATAAAEAQSESGGGGTTTVIISPEEQKRLDAIKAGLADLMNQVKQYGMDDDQLALLKLIDLGASEQELATARGLLDELKVLREAEENAKLAAEEKLAMEQEVLRLVESTRTEVERHAELVGRIGALYQAGAITSIEQYEEILVRVNEQFVESTKKVNELDEFGKQAARNLQDHFAEFLFDPFDEGISGMLKGFSETIRRMAAEAAAASLFKNLFGEEGGSGGWLGQIMKGFGGSGGGSGGGGGGWGSVISGIAGMFGGARAAGGPVAAGVPYLVGERGPELMVPRQSGTVVPNHGMGRETVNNVYHTNITLPPESKRRTAEQQSFYLARELQLRVRRNG